MVVDRAVGDAAPAAPGLTERETDRLFHALADATRRDIVRTALTGEHSVSALAARYATSFAAVQKHVAVLTEVGLVRKTRSGREQRVTTDVGRLRSARDALDELAQRWQGRMDRFGEVLGEDGRR